MPIYIYKGNNRISTNAIRNDKVVKAIYAKEQGQEAVCVWGIGLNTWVLRYTKTETSVIIDGLKEGVTWESLTIPKIIENLPVHFIGNSAFKNNTRIRYIELPNSLLSIEEYAFYSCTGLMSITIPNSVTSIGYEAFYNCTGLTSITIPDSVTSISQYAFYNTAWYNNQLDGLVYAGRVAYDYKGTMPNNTSIVIKNGTLSITEYIFYDYKSLVSVTIPDSVTNIGSYAFYGCSGLTSITIPNKVKSIGDGAFKNCTGLTTVNWNATKCTSAGSQNGYIFYGCSNLTTVNIGNNVKTIPTYTFMGCNSLTTITIPDSVTSIGDLAFSSCDGLTRVTIGNGVTSIGKEAFKHCKELTSVTIGNSVTSIGEYAFAYTAWDNNQPYGVVYAGKVLYRYKGNIPSNTSIVLKEGTLGIGDFAFQHLDNPNHTSAGLSNITIPNSVVNIGKGAFYTCTGLTSITFNGTKAQWNAITKGGNWNDNTGNYTIHCTDGDIPK